jgi:hypothetical protein
MELPEFSYTLVDRARGVTYVVRGYKQPTREEAVRRVQQYQATHPTPKRGHTVTLLSADDMKPAG